MKVKPLSDRVLVKPVKAETKTAAGIILTAENNERTKIADVIETGANIPFNLNPGDKIMYDIHTGIKLKIDGEDYVILHFLECLAVVE